MTADWPIFMLKFFWLDDNNPEKTPIVGDVDGVIAIFFLLRVSILIDIVVTPAWFVIDAGVRQFWSPTIQL